LEDIQSLRKCIDEIDVQILKMLSERVAICQKIGKYKKQHNLSIQDKSREQEVFSKVRDRAVEFGLEPDRIETLYREIVNMCCAIQK
jgi:chorismate mutase-like protein